MLAIFAIWVLLSGLDDLFLDLAFLYRWFALALARRRARSACPPTEADLLRAPRKRIAIFVPLWREHNVVRKMVEHNLKANRYGHCDFFIGVYPNDEPTLVQEAMMNVAKAEEMLAGIPKADSKEPRGSLDQAMQPYKNIQVQDESEFVGDATGQIDQLVQFFQLLLALSVGIAILGIVNTLALSVLERTRELGLLRAVGMSRRQVKRMVRVESVLVAVFGGLLGLAVGVVFGVALQRALVSQGVTELSFPIPQLAGYLLLAAVAGVLAAWLPARRASKLNVLQAVAAD